ncbi:MAG: HlyD family efflux transporter periplasmic adaptor subunit [Deltaproteobacteria bacterium]|nr:HlyD family efflux transporter periplasmic adaptor subunit [Deltaproteobacteria bacterium]
MDRKIEKKWLPLKKLIPILVIGFVIIFLSYQVISRSGTTRLRVDPSRITLSQVKYGEFQEYYPFDGTVIPLTSVYLDVEQGGRVEEIFVEGGKPIQKGDLILRFSNTTLQTNLISTENSLLENLDRQRNTQLQLAKDKLTRKEMLLNLTYETLKLEKQYKRYSALNEEKIGISEEDYETLYDQVEYKKAQMALQKERNKQEDLIGDEQLVQAKKAIERINLSLDLLTKQIESLNVKAPISGYLSSISAEIGQNIIPGQRIGQIDILDKFKIRAGVDQYYNSKVTVGTKGKFTLDGKSYGVEVTKIYPEVINNLFTVDMAFSGEVPDGIKRGQTLTVELSFGEPGQSLMVNKGGFYQQTGGRWVYLVSKDGMTANRVDIRLGRQNPRNVEVLEGLNAGDMVITSGYDSFKEADELVFEGAVELKE